MREKMKPTVGRRLLVQATVDQFSVTRGRRPQPTMLLTDVMDAATKERLCDHLWFTQGKWSAGVAQGDSIEFEARGANYRKGNFESGWSRDVKLNNPTKVRVLNREVVKSIGASAPEPPPLPEPPSGATKIIGWSWGRPIYGY